MPRRVRLEAGAVDDGPFGNEPVQLFPRRAAQQMADEQPVPGQFRHHPHIQPMHRVGPGIKVLHEIVAALHMGQHVRMQPVEPLGRHRRIVLPPDRLFHRRRTHHMLVLGRASGELSGRYEEGPTLAQTPLAALHGLFHKAMLKEIVIDVPQTGDALMCQFLRGVHATVRHTASSSVRAVPGTLRSRIANPGQWVGWPSPGQGEGHLSAITRRSRLRTGRFRTVSATIAGLAQSCGETSPRLHRSGRQAAGMCGNFAIPVGFP